MLELCDFAPADEPDDCAGSRFGIEGNLDDTNVFVSVAPPRSLLDIVRDAGVVLKNCRETLETVDFTNSILDANQPRSTFCGLKPEEPGAKRWSRASA
jgi:hypothetical protein